MYQLVNYYPKYKYLDDIISATEKDVLNLFIDLKGCMQTLYMEWGIKYVLEQSRGKYADPTIFSSILQFIQFHKNYAKKRNIEINLYFFYERGKSDYHLSIREGYKKSRKQADFFGLDTVNIDLFYSILEKNLVVSNRICNRIPNVWFLELQFLEADFVPWYLMNHVLDCDDQANIIYSTDKDMYQCLDNPNKYQFHKHYKSHKLLNQETSLNTFFGKEVSKEYHYLFPLALAIIGDNADDITGINGFAGKTTADLLPSLAEYFPSTESFLSCVREEKKLFDQNFIELVGTNFKKCHKLVDNEKQIRDNLRLVSFQLLTEYFNGNFPLQIKEKRESFLKYLNYEKIENPKVLYKALRDAGLDMIISEQVINGVF